MKIKTILTILILVLDLPIIMVAQSPLRLNPGLDNLVPPSPNAVALEKFTDIQVGQSTGIPQINVPLYAYENVTSGVKLGISLDYHAGGIKVDEMSSNIGCGWALNAGGVISRTLRSIPDEREDYGFIKSAVLSSDESQGNKGSSECDRPYMKVYNDLVDGQNDIFNFNFAGRSGRFVYGKNNDFLMLTSNKLKIDKVEGTVSGVAINSIKQFIITDESGIKYYFDALEISECPWIKQPGNSIFVSSWYLTKILPPSGSDAVLFEYENYQITYNLSSSASMAISLSGSWQDGTYSQSLIGQTVKGKRIKKISFPNNVTLSFLYNLTQRADLPGDNSLQKITISDGIAQRGYKLLQDYSVNRLTLNKVIPILGINEQEDAGYIFEYYSSLPERLSYEQDHWGYYNTNTTTSLFPEEYFINPSNINGYIKLPGGNKSTDPNRVKAGSMTKITYPTGGSAVFDLEANQAVDQQLDHTLQVTSKQRSASISFSPSATATNFPFQGDPNSNTHVKISFQYNGECPSGQNCYVNINVKDNLGNVANTYAISIPSTTSPQTIVREYNNANYTSAKTYTISCQTSGLANFYSWISFDWDETRIANPVITNVGNKEMFVGGLRAKKIFFYDRSGNTSSTKEYTYTMEDETTSSGTLGVFPTYTNDVCYDWKNMGLGVDNVETYTGSACFKSRSSSPIIANSFVNGSPVLYKRVVEKRTSNGVSAGRSERYFTSFSDYPLINTAFPYGPAHYNEWSYGLLIKELIYEENNPNPIKTTENIYKMTTGDYYSNQTRMENFKSLTLAPVKYRLQCGIPGYAACSNNFWGLIGSCPLYFKATSTYSYPGRSDIEQSIISDFDKNGNVLKTTKQYQYNASYYYISKELNTNSKGEQITINYLHPADMTSAGRDNTGVYQDMINNNVINATIETITQKGSTNLATSRTNYYKPSTGLFKPQTVTQQVLTQPEITLLQYKQYNSNGQLLSCSKINDVEISYVWSKKYGQPVAKIIGADYSAVSAKITQSVIDNPADDQALRDELNKLRSIAGSIVTSYTYSALTGMTSETDPSGKATYYEYDGFGRLKLIRDNNKSIIKEFDYKYNNQ